MIAMRAKHLLLLVALTSALLVPAGSTKRAIAQGRPTRSVWIDPSTGLMWAAKDNGKDVSWRKAMKFCGDLRLDGYSDWRLATIAELQSIYDKTAEAPGQAGPSKSPDDFTWHVKGNLFLTGDEWSGRPVSGRMPMESYEYHFDFNEGRADKDPSGWPYPSSGMRALCVRGPDKGK
jgi:hypothetical protein